MADRVLHLYADYKWTGPSEPVVRLCAELTRRGRPCDLACMDAGPGRHNVVAERAEAEGLTVFRAFAPPGTGHLRRFLHERRAVRKLVASGGYRLLHCHGSWDHLVAGWRRRARGAPPLIRTDHAAREYLPWRPHWKWFYGPAMADHLVVLAERFAVQAIDRMGLPYDGVTAVRGAVDADDFAPMAAPDGLRERLGLARDDVVIGVVSRVQRHRRFDVLLEAMERVRRRNGRVKLVVCGRGTHKEELLDEPVKALGLQDTIHALGYVRDGYRETIAAFDAGLMLVPGSDGSCRAALQMAAMEKPLIVAYRGTLPDIVVDGRTGIVVRDEPVLLADGILQMAADAEQRRRWGRAARQRVQALFSPAREADEIEAVYDRVLGR